MNECVWILLGFMAVVAITLYIIYLCNLHSRVCRLERKASPRLEIIEREVHGIGCYMRILVGLAIFFCLCVCVHYISYCYPRYIPPKQTGFDYMGVIVGVMAAMITLLVGWQIFSNIKERERIDKLAEANDKFQKEMLKFRDGLEPRMSKMEKCCEEREKQIIAIDEKVDAHINATLLVRSSEALIKGIDTKSKLNRSDALRVSIAYSSLLRAILQFVQTKGKIENVRGCISKLKTCLLLFWDNGKFDKSQYDECAKLYDEIVVAISEHTQYSILLDELKEANEWRTKIGWDKDAERIHEYFKTNNNG